MLLFLIIIGVASACSSTKKMSYDELMEGAPSWVRQTPGDPAAYHGVGMASKLTDDNYREKARQNALAELAGSISVTISATSVLNQFEFDNNYSDYYRDNIRLSTQNQLEGFELAGSWENAQQYWVYFVLPKNVYQQKMAARIGKARNLSEDKYDEARRMYSSGNRAEALRFHVQAVEEIKEVLGEDLGADEQTGKSWSTMLFSDFAAHVQNLRIEYPVEEIRVKRGESPAGGSMDAGLMDAAGNPVGGVPVSCRLSWLKGRDFDAQTDAQGRFRLSMKPLNSAASSEFISSNVDLDRLITEYTADPMVRKLLGAVRVPEFVLPVTVEPLRVFVAAELENLGQASDATALVTSLRNLFEKEGFQISRQPSDADFEVTTSAATKSENERNGRFSASLKATVIVKDKAGKERFFRTVDDVSGLGGDFDSAGRDAIDAFINRLNINIYPEIQRVILYQQ